MAEKEEIVLSCTECGQTLKSEQDLDTHLEKHQNAKIHETRSRTKEDHNNTMVEIKEEISNKQKRKIKDGERIYQCTVCYFQTTDFNEHNKHRKTRHQLAVSSLPLNKTPIQLKRKLVTLKSALFDCDKCGFSTKNKYYLPTHMKLVHAKVPKKSDLIRSNSIESSSSIKSPPKKAQKVKENSNVVSEDVEMERNLENEEIDLCFQKLLRSKSIKEVATNTETVNDETTKNFISNLENQIKKYKGMLVESSEVIQNLEEENEDLHKKVNYLGNNAELVDQMLQENDKIKKEAYDSNQSCILCDEANITIFELRYHLRKIHDVEDDPENEEHDDLKNWLKSLRDIKENEKKTFQNQSVQCDKEGNQTELQDLRETVKNKNISLQKYEEILKQAEAKYKEDQNQIEILQREKTEIESNLKLVKKAVKVAESKLQRELGQYVTDQEEEMDTSNIEEIVQNKKSGYKRPNPQSKSEVIYKSQSLKNIKDIIPCNQCGKQFMKDSHLKTHMKCHESESGSHACSQCSETFNSKQDLHVHVKRHEDGDHNCTECDYEVNSKEALMKHKEAKHSKKNEPTCKFCAQKFTFKYQLINHVLENHKSHKPCSKFSENKCELDSECRFNHIILEEGTYICYTCGYKSDHKTENMKHIKAKHGETPCQRYAENRCGFSSKDCLYSHRLTNHTQQHNRSLTTTQSQQTNRPTQSQVFQNIQQNPRPLEHPPEVPQLVNIPDMIPQLMQNMMQQMSQMTHILAALKSGSQ